MENICCFAGHNDIYINNKTDEKIKEKIKDLRARLGRGCADLRICTKKDHIQIFNFGKE